MCGKGVCSDLERVQNKLGPLTFWFCSEKCEMLYWHLRNTKRAQGCNLLRLIHHPLALGRRNNIARIFTAFSKMFSQLPRNFASLSRARSRRNRLAERTEDLLPSDAACGASPPASDPRELAVTPCERDRLHSRLRN